MNSAPRRPRHGAAAARTGDNKHAGARTFTAAVVGMTVLFFAACSPKYDWRTMTDDTGRYAASFPAKPMWQEQKVDVNGTTLTMRMQTASVGNDVFAIGSVVLPPAQPGGAVSPALRKAALDLVTQGVAQNLAPDIAPTDIQMPAADGRSLAAQAWAASGTVAGTKQARAVVARFVATDDRVYEAVIVGDEAPDTKVANTFFSGFKPF